MNSKTVYQKPRTHEKRWKQLVGPLVNTDGQDRLFLDLGCNAGFYMQKAVGLGYRAVGVEREPGFIAQAPKELEIVQGDVTLYQPPSSYLTLMACVHYHQADAKVESILHQLFYSTANLLVMGRHKGRVTSKPDQKHLMRLLRGWDLVDSRKTDKFYTVLVKNRMVSEFDVEELYENTVNHTKKVGGHTDFFEPFAEFVRRVSVGDKQEYDKTPFWAYLRKRGLRYRHGLCFWYEHLIEQSMRKGIDSMLINKGPVVIDGHHRLVIARELGIKRLISRSKWVK